MIFRTHKREVVSGELLNSALNKVADDMILLAEAIREEDAYASHISEQEKDQYMADDIEHAERVRLGEGLNNFTIWQRVNEVLTNECVSFLPSMPDKVE